MHFLITFFLHTRTRSTRTRVILYSHSYTRVALLAIGTVVHSVENISYFCLPRDSKFKKISSSVSLEESLSHSSEAEVYSLCDGSMNFELYFNIKIEK